jgi:autotransporter-associated beta strand protein
MQTTKTSKTAWFFAMLLCFGLGSAQAASITNADAAVNLNLGGSWVGGTPAGSADVAVWNNLVVNNTNKALGANVNWAGIRVADPGQPITISPNVYAAPVIATLNSPTFTYSSAPAIPLANGNPAFLGGTTAPTGFTLNLNYFVVNATATTFQLSATSGGTAISVGATTEGTNVTVTGTGTGGPTLTLGASGVDMSLAMNGLNLGCPIVLGADQTWNIGSGRILSIANAPPYPGLLQGSAILTKAGSGTLILRGLNTYSGGTVVNGGVLQINNGTTGTGTSGTNSAGIGGMTLNDGATLQYGTAVNMGNTFTANGTVFVDMNTIGGSMLLNGSWFGAGTVIITNAVSGTTLTIGGNGVGGGNMNSFTGAVVVASITSQGFAATNNLRLNDSGGNNNLGNANASFDLGNGVITMTTRNRTGSTISLGELKGGASTQIRVGSSGSSGTTYSVGGKNTDSTFDGTFDGTGSGTGTFLALTKVGTGTFTLTGANTNNGVTTISGGKLQIGNGGTSGQLGIGSVVNNAELVFNRSDATAVSNNISGSGTTTKVGANTLTYYGTNTSSTLISQGILVLGVSGFINAPVFVASGATFDVSQNPAFLLNSTVSGFGTVSGLLTGTTGGTISPGGSGAAGTLSFANGLTESGNVNHQMELSTVGGTNDLINITGNLTLSGVNNVTLTHFGGGSIPNGTYTLITYSGSLSGSLANLAAIATANTAILTNPPNQIAVIIREPPRSATNLTWVGDGGANNWDLTTSNWVNGHPFAFQAGDSVIFDQTGAANSTVNLGLTVSPASVVVSNTTSYILTGSGSIGGSGALVKTNSGTLNLLTANGYTGPTVIGGGTLVVSTLANGTLSSGIGAAGSNPTNLVFFGTTLSYTGPNASSDRGATLNGSGGVFDVIAGTTLTLNGTLIGPGALTLVDSGTLTLGVPNTYSGGTVLSNGVLALGSSLANYNGAGGSGVGPTNEPVTFYGGTLQLFGTETGVNYNTLFNPLVVPAGQTGTLIMFPRGPVNSGAGSGLQSSLTGGGTLNLVVNYLRDDLSGNWSAFNGLINVTAKNGADEMRINNNFGYANATIFLNDGVTLDRSFTANTTNDIGALNGSSLAVVGPGVNSGLNPTWRVGWKNTDATFSGTIADDGSTTIIKVGSGTWTLNGYNVYTGPTIISNGVLAVNSLASTNINVAAGAVLDVSAAGTLSLATGQTLGGNGTVWGSVDASGGGTIAPGSSIGTLTVTNTVTLGGNTLMEVNRNSVPKSDKLVAAAISLGGTLTVVNIGPALHIGDTFDLFDGALSGSFATLELGHYYTWNTSQLAAGGNGTITVAGLLPVPTLGATVSGTNVVLSSSGGFPGGQLTVITSTNLSAPVDTWTTVQNDVFDGSGNYSLTIPINSGIAQQFYAIHAF